MGMSPRVCVPSSPRRRSACALASWRASRRRPWQGHPLRRGPVLRWEETPASPSGPRWSGGSGNAVECPQALVAAEGGRGGEEDERMDVEDRMIIMGELDELGCKYCVTVITLFSQRLASPLCWCHTIKTIGSQLPSNTVTLLAVRRTFATFPASDISLNWASPSLLSSYLIFPRWRMAPTVLHRLWVSIRLITYKNTCWKLKLTQFPN